MSFLLRSELKRSMFGKMHLQSPGRQKVFCAKQFAASECPQKLALLRETVQYIVRIFPISPLSFPPGFIWWSSLYLGSYFSLSPSLSLLPLEGNPLCKAPSGNEEGGEGERGGGRGEEVPHPVSHILLLRSLVYVLSNPVAVSFPKQIKT